MITNTAAVLAMLSSFESLWANEIGGRIIAVFSDLAENDDYCGTYEFNFCDKNVVQLTVEHLGLTAYGAPILPGEYVTRVPLMHPCIGKRITGAYLRYNEYNRPGQFRLDVEGAIYQFSFLKPVYIVEEAADDLEGWKTIGVG